jgi:hypothetical protein
MKYEYKIIHTSREMSENQLNLLGGQGWELVSVTFIESMLTYYIKRVKVIKSK